MIGKTDKNPQLNVFCIPLVNVINMKHELVELSQRINWKSIERDFTPYYSDMVCLAVPVWKMVSCLFCPGFVDRQLVSKMCHCTELLKDKTS